MTIFVCLQPQQVPKCFFEGLCAMNFVHARKHTRCVFFAAAHRVSRLFFFWAELLFGLTYCFFTFVSSHHFLSAHGSPTVSSLSDTDRWKIERKVAAKRKSNIVQHQVLAITCDIREKTRAIFFRLNNLSATTVHLYRPQTSRNH